MGTEPTKVTERYADPYSLEGTIARIIQECRDIGYDDIEIVVRLTEYVEWQIEDARMDDWL